MTKIANGIPVRTRVPIVGWMLAATLTIVSLCANVLHDRSKLYEAANPVVSIESALASVFQAVDHST